MEKDVLKTERFKGEIEIDGVASNVTFTLSAGPDFRLKFEIDPIGTELYLHAMRRSGKPGEEEQSLAIRGESDEGKRVSSDNLFLNGVGSNGDGYYINVTSNLATVTTPLARPAKAPLLRLWFRSFQSFRNPLLETPLGLLQVHGDTHVDDPDKVSGAVAIQAYSSDVGEGWYNAADDLLRHMHRGLAFAHGGRLQTPRLDYSSGELATTTFFAGRGFQSEFPVFHQLNHGPFIRALVDRYQNQGPLHEEIWHALNWIQTGSTFDEIRFLTGMTAIETIVESQLPVKKGTIIPKSKFRELRNKIQEVISSNEILSVEIKEKFNNGVASLNRKTLREKIDALFDQFQISRQDFGGEVIGGLVGLRNEIVHRGAIPEKVEIWPQILLVREIITRIILNEVGFSGKYLCYVDGYGERVFPYGE